MPSSTGRTCRASSSAGQARRRTSSPAQGYLHHELQKKVIDTFDTGYTDEYGLKELVERAKEKLVGPGPDAREAPHHAPAGGDQQAGRRTGRIRRGPGPAAPWQIGAVDTLLLSEGLRKKRFTMECASCGWKQVVTVGQDARTEYGAPPAAR